MTTSKPTFNKKTKSWDNLPSNTSWKASSEIQGTPTKTDLQVRKNKEAWQKSGRTNKQMGSSGPTIDRANKRDGTTVYNPTDKYSKPLVDPNYQIAVNQINSSPSGWKKLVDFTNLLSDKSSSSHILPDNYNITLNKMNPFLTLGMHIKAVKGTKAVSKLAKLGTIKTGATAIERAMQVNTVTNKATASMLTKMASKLPHKDIIVGAIMGAIGSYPFAGFIKEEALQSLEYSRTAALRNDDTEGFQIALDQSKEILNPDLWQKIINAVPYANSVSALKEYYQAATTKVAIDEQILKDYKYKLEYGETDAEMYDRIDKERKETKEQERIADAEYYANIERLRIEAKAKERADDEAYWNKILSDREKNTKKQEKQSDDYWSEYYKTMAKVRADSTPSNLKFGLL